MGRVILKRITALFVVFGLIFAVALFFIEKQGYRRSINAPLVPAQSPAEGTVQLSREGYNVNLDLLYEYRLEGLVVITEDYTGTNNPSNVFSPKDVTVVWGKAAEYNNKIDFKWRHSARHSYHYITSQDAIKYFGGISYLNAEVSNNHIIPADDKVRKEVEMIRTGDHIIIEGYLVNADFGRYGTWRSSTTRLDTGDGACEIIYVTNVKWVAD